MTKISELASRVKGAYVYAYMRIDGKTPYYIGKGVGRRAWSKHWNNDHTVETIRRPANIDRIVILQDGLTDEQAVALEISLITLWGRKDKGTGCLRNLTDGGEGAVGRKQTMKTKEKLRLANLGKKASRKAKENMSIAQKGRKHSLASIDKRVLKLRGKTRSKDQRLSMREVQGRVHPRRRWMHRDHGIIEARQKELVRIFPELKLDQGALGRVFRGKASHHKGWTCLDS